MKYLYHRNYVKVLFAPTIFSSFDILPIFFASAMDLLSALLPWTSSLQCAPCSLGARRRTHWPTIWWKSVYLPLVWAAVSGYPLFIWAPSQAFPSHPLPGSSLGYIVKLWPSKFLFHFLTWNIAAVPTCGGMLLTAPYLVSFDIPQY